MTTAAQALVGTRTEALRGLTRAVGRQREGLGWLLRAARSGDSDAFAEIVRRFQTQVYHLTVRMVRRPSVAEDLSQEVFIRLWRHLGRIEGPERVPAWIRRVAANAVVDYWRKEEVRERKLRVLREHPVARRTVRPSSRMETTEATDAVQAALERLPAKLRSVVVLRAMEGLSYDELADVLGISTNAVRSRLFRARQLFHEELKRERADVYLAQMYRPAGP